MEKMSQVGISQGQRGGVAPGVVCVEVPPGTDPIQPSLPLSCARGAQLSPQLINQNWLCWSQIALKINSFERLGLRAGRGPFSPLEMSQPEGEVRAVCLGPWLWLCLGRAPLERWGPRSPKRRGAAVLWATTGQEPLLLRNMIPLEIWELQGGGCAPPNPIPVGGTALLSSHRQPGDASPGVLWLKSIHVAPPPMHHHLLFVCNISL